MSFFDDDDPPTRARPAARPAARPRQPDASARPGSLAPQNADSLRNRRIGLGIGILVFIVLLGLLVSSCRSSARDRALKSYNTQVTALVEKSGSNSQQLFAALNRSDASAQDTQTAIQAIRVEAEDTAKRAANLDVRDQMKPAQKNLLLVLDLRAGAIGEIADLLPDATGNDRTAAVAVQEIAGQMRAFLASDVLYSLRVRPLIDEALRNAGIGGQTVAESVFLQNDGWLSTRQVANKINPTAIAGSRSGETPAPGPHGHGLISAKVAGTQLQTGGATTSVSVSAGARPALEAVVANQGNSDETDVVVSFKVTIAGVARTVKTTLDVTKTGQQSTARATMPQTVKPGDAAEVEVSVAGVPKETNLTNNKATYVVHFIQ